MKLTAKDVLLVVGKRGAGKTTWVQKNIVKKSRRVIVFDPHAEYATQQRVNIDELCADSSVLDAEALSLGVTPKWHNSKDCSEQFELFADLMESAENAVIVVDECRLLRRYAAEALDTISCQSRHWGCPLVMVAQRAIQIPKDSREQASHIVSFLQSSPDDVAALVDICGEDAFGVKSLPRYESFAWCEDEAFGKCEEEKEK
jgi:energy-coupling factor transporter ATP-binding protein EcfA2